MILLNFAQQIGLKPRWKACTGGGEYHSPCPECGGTDRFYIQPHKQMRNCIGYFRCRRCGIHGDSIEFARKFLHLSFPDAVAAANATIATSTYLSTIKKSYPAPSITLQKPPTGWVASATDYVSKAHEQLLLKDDILQFLSTRGLPLAAVKHYKLGWSDRDEYISRSSWGLSEENDPDGRKHKLWIPSGIVIPTAEINGEVVRIKIRRHAWKEGDIGLKYVIVSGSMNGLSLIGNTTHDIMIAVESELDAYALHFVAREFAFTVAVGSNMKNPDNVVDRLAKHKRHLLICHDNDKAGLAMLNKWQERYAHAKSYPTPIGKDVGEAIATGLDIRTWLLQAIEITST
jgi:DNA primase